MQPIRYDVIDSHTGKVVASFKSLARAIGYVNRKDNEYGGYRYSRRPVYSN